MPGVLDRIYCRRHGIEKRQMFMSSPLDFALLVILLALDCEKYGSELPVSSLADFILANKKGCFFIY